MGKFGWISLINAIPAIVMGTQHLLAGQNGSTKKQQVLGWIGLGEGVAEVADPAMAPVINLANQQIDQWVQVFHATNAPGFGTNAAPAAPAQA